MRRVAGKLVALVVDKPFLAAGAVACVLLSGAARALGLPGYLESWLLLAGLGLVLWASIRGAAKSL